MHHGIIATDRSMHAFKEQILIKSGLINPKFSVEINMTKDSEKAYVLEWSGLQIYK